MEEPFFAGFALFVANGPHWLGREASVSGHVRLKELAGESMLWASQSSAPILMKI